MNLANIDFSELALGAILPSVVLVFGALCLLLINVFLSASAHALRRLNVALGMVFLTLSIIFSLNLSFGGSFFGLINITGISVLSQVLMELSALLFVALFWEGGAGANASNVRSINGGIASIEEFFPLFLLMIAGFDIMVSSTHLLIILLGLEIGSLCLIALIALSGKNAPESTESNRKACAKRDFAKLDSINLDSINLDSTNLDSTNLDFRKSAESTSRALLPSLAQNLEIEASIKYFILSVLASVFFIFGAWCFYFASASFDLSYIQEALQSAHYTSAFAVLIGLVFMLGAIGFKASMVPFHSWMPDVYEGSSALIAGVVSIIPKIAAFAVAIVVFGAFIEIGVTWINNALYALIILTITIPNIAALVQQDLKRMLAFSSISHSGFVLACVLIDTQMSLTSLYLYWFLFAFSNIGAFGLLWFAPQRMDSGAESKLDSMVSKAESALESRQESARFTYPISRFNGMLKISPMYAMLSAIFLFSLAGIPPFGLFWGKIYVVISACSADYPLLTVIMMINSAIAAFYYLKPVVAMFLRAPNASAQNAKQNASAQNNFNAQNFDTSNNFGTPNFNTPNPAQTPARAGIHVTTLGKIIIGGSAFICCISIFMVQFLLDFIGKYVIGAY